MHLADLPVEISENILDYLPRHAKQQCLLVSKLWHQATLPGLNRYIQLLGNEDVLILYRKMFHPPVTIKGSDIRCLSLTVEKVSDRYIVRRDVLGPILNACVHLRTLHLLHDSNQFLEYMYQARSELHVDALQTIYIPFNVVNRVIRDMEFRAIFHYCQKITQISLNTNRYTAVRDIPDNMDLTNYLSKFTCLQTLAIHFDNELILHDIISACPQLESLRLFGASFLSLTTKLRMYRTDSATEKPVFSVKSQLHTLFIDTTFFSKDLLEYLAIHTTHFYQLTLCGSVSRGTQNLVTAFTAYSQQPRLNALALKCIRFENHLSYSNELMQHIKHCFSSSLRRINFTQCDFNDIRDDGNNLTLDLTGLNLDYLTIDIQNVLEGRIASLNKTSLEVTTTNNAIPKTVYFQRKSKWKPENLFLLKQSNQYTNQNAQKRRLKSDHTCVLAIKADSIHYIKLHCHNQDSRQPFSQIVNLGA
ncbi:hypothetical protein MAM1_0021c01844 [Mucor ambiguus]|uniref:F-box domain-containing protein n=1 Tax=Mucor ambiguus TaxID=91626 RepID=A0A0C9M1Q2_9FUNG|nr:hypothetical protein MAM1_0021c01844 [Mucor ambiguus]